MAQLVEHCAIDVIDATVSQADYWYIHFLSQPARAFLISFKLSSSRQCDVEIPVLLWLMLLYCHSFDTFIFFPRSIRSLRSWKTVRGPLKVLSRPDSQAGLCSTRSIYWPEHSNQSRSRYVHSPLHCAFQCQRRGRASGTLGLALRHYKHTTCSP